MIVTGIAGVLLGLLFGWMRHQTVLNELGEIVDKMFAREESEDAKRKAYWGAVWDAALDLPEERGDCQEPDADQSAIIRSGCTCGTTSAAPCPFHDSWRLNSTTHVTQMDPNAQWTHTAQAGQTEKGD